VDPLTHRLNHVSRQLDELYPAGQRLNAMYDAAPDGSRQKQKALQLMEAHNRLKVSLETEANEIMDEMED